MVRSNTAEGVVNRVSRGLPLGKIIRGQISEHVLGILHFYCQERLKELGCLASTKGRHEFGIEEKVLPIVNTAACIRL